MSTAVSARWNRVLLVLYLVFGVSGIPSLAAAEVPDDTEGAMAASVAVSVPTHAVSLFGAAGRSFSEIEVTWKDISEGVVPTGYLIVGGRSQPLPEPVDGVELDDDIDFSDGSVVLNVPPERESVVFGGLAASTPYIFEIFPYIRATEGIRYNTDGEPAAITSTLTPRPEPSGHVSDLKAEAVGRGLQISWAKPLEEPLPDGFVVWVGDSPKVRLPMDGMESEVDADLSDGEALLDVDGGSSEVSVTAAPGSRYYVAVFPYSNSGPHINYRLDSPFPVTAATTAPVPVVQSVEDTDPSNDSESISPASDESVTKAISDGFGMEGVIWESRFPERRVSAETLAAVSDASEGGTVGPKANETAAESRLERLTALRDPLNVSAFAIGPSEVEVSYAPSSSREVMVVFNETGAFEHPSGEAPGVGDSFAGGTVLSRDTETRLIHSGLKPGERLHYYVFSTNGFDYSPGVYASATPGLVSREDFEDEPRWENRTVTGSIPWDISEGAARIADPPESSSEEKHYLVSPAFDFSSMGLLRISFDVGGIFDTSALELLYSLNYRGEENPESEDVVWLPIPFEMEELSPEQGSTRFRAREVSLPEVVEGFSGVSLAFRFTGGETASKLGGLYVDNILIFYAGLPEAMDPISGYLDEYGLTINDLKDDSIDRDGLPVIVEYLVNGNPYVADSPRFSSAVMERAGGQRQLVFEFSSSRSDEPEGVTIKVLGSNDPSDEAPFVPISFEYLEATENGDGTYTHRYRQIAPIGDEAAKSILRLQVTHGRTGVSAQAVAESEGS